MPVVMNGKMKLCTSRTAPSSTVKKKKHLMIKIKEGKSGACGVTVRNQLIFIILPILIKLL